MLPRLASFTSGASRNSSRHREEMRCGGSPGAVRPGPRVACRRHGRCVCDDRHSRLTRRRTMVSITRILCPVDFSTCSRRALDYALAIGRWYGASVTALHVFPDLPVIDGVPMYRGQPLVLKDQDPATL